MKRKTMILLVIVLILAVILSVRIFSKKEDKAEQTQKEVEEIEKDLKDQEIDEEGFELKEAGNIYYLTGNVAAFRDKLSAFLKSHGIHADTVTALSKFEDDPASETGNAKFYLQTDSGILIDVNYDKGTDQFTFSESEEEIENIEDYGGIPQKQEQKTQEPEYATQGLEEMDFGAVKVTDNEGQLSEVEDDKEKLERQILVFLTAEQEERRNLSVLSADRTEKGYEAALLFENPRSDGKYVWVVYNEESGLYRMELREE